MIRYCIPIVIRPFSCTECGLMTHEEFSIQKYIKLIQKKHNFFHHCMENVSSHKEFNYI